MALANTVSGYIAAFIALGGWFAVNYQKQSDLFERQAEFEKYKTTEEAKLRERELVIEKERLRLSGRLKEVEDANGRISEREGEVEKKFSSLREQQGTLAQVAQSLSPLVQRSQEEAQIRRLMEEFSALGVDLHAPPPCDEGEALKRYNHAKALLPQIASRANAAGVYEKYRGFIQSNSRTIFLSREQCR